MLVYAVCSLAKRERHICVSICTCMRVQERQIAGAEAAAAVAAAAYKIGTYPGSLMYEQNELKS